jgi:hypothetical protein
VSNLILSFRESSNLCILDIIFLGSYLDFIHVRFYILWLFPRQDLDHTNLYKSLLVFLVIGDFTNLSLKRGQTFHHLF